MECTTIFGFSVIQVVTVLGVIGSGLIAAIGILWRAYVRIGEEALEAERRARARERELQAETTATVIKMLNVGARRSADSGSDT